MTEVKNYIAVDLGAESGRIMLGSISTDKITLEEIHRFNNGPIKESSSLRWDFERLLSDVKAGINKAVKKTGDNVEGIGIDSWGVDFGLIGADGKLIENPYHYRDSRTNGIMEKAFKLISKRQIYENTGIQFIQLNSVYQLLSMRLSNSVVLDKTKKLLFMADLFSYYLCGRAFGEYTLASTSQLMDMRTGRWSQNMFDKLSLPINIMPDIVEPGTIVGKLSKSIANELGCAQIPFIAIGSHDTASAVAAVPAEKGNWAYLSSGTWSLIGEEVPQAIVNDKTFKCEFTNEGGVENTIRLLKNIMGLWLVQECKRQWGREGVELSYTELTEMAQKAKPFAVHIEVDDSGFLAPGNIPKRINDYLAKTGQKPIQDKGQMIRVILESLAFKYRLIIERIEDVTGQKVDCLHIVGGGIQNELLSQFAANATGKRIIAGPVEATAAGNILMQAKATGQIKNLAEARAIVRNSFELKEYRPKDVSLWEERFVKRDASCVTHYAIRTTHDEIRGMRLIEELEQKLDSFNPAERKQALMSLCEMVAAGEISLPEPGSSVNMHCHTFFSYNTYGYSPSKFAWLARRAGLAAAQVVDFDVLNAADEFLNAAKMLNLKGCAGMETRVYVPEFSDRVINSPGEPGISYHMGVGFPGSHVPDDQKEFLLSLRETAQQRNRDLISRVNKYLEPLSLDYKRDVLPLTPANNPTERHICLAYARKAKDIFGQTKPPVKLGAKYLADFWSKKLGTDAEQLGLPEGKNLLNTIRAKTMKRGGIGYVQPDKGSFPTMADMNRFVLASGGIPVHTWLDGTSDGEKAIDELLRVAMSTGAAALNIIPDRNYTPGSPDLKLKNLYQVVELAEKLNLPVVVGTEMNSPGQKFVDDFASKELALLVPIFLKGAHIVYAHSVLQQKCGLGYTSKWAKKNFANVVERNNFFHRLGSSLKPDQEDKLAGFNEKSKPKEILNKIKNQN